MRNSDIPADLTGSHPLVSYINKLKRCIKRRTPLPGTGYKLRMSEDGFTQEVIPGGGGTTAASSVSAFLLQTVYSATTVPNGYVLGCLKYSGIEGGALESSITYVARSFKLRPIASRFVNGILWSYAYSADYTQRIATSSGRPSENQVIIPYFIPPYGAGANHSGYVGDVIYALKLPGPIFTINTGTVANPIMTDVNYVDINADGRAWSKAE